MHYTLEILNANHEHFTSNHKLPTRELKEAGPTELS